MTTTITKEIQFDMAHRLKDYDGPCSRLHGHRYRMLVTVDGRKRPDRGKEGMVIDFAVLKAALQEVVSEYDHHTVLQKGDPLQGVLDEARDGVWWSLFPPTAENLAEYLFAQITARLAREDIGLVRVVLYETPSSSAEVTRAGA